MKNIFTFPLISFILISLLSSCAKDAVVVDPEGTITVSMNYTVAPHNGAIVLYQDRDEARSLSDNMPYVMISVGILDAGMNFSFSAVNSGNISIDHPYAIYANQGGEIANVGSVEGLGAVTTKPNSGWTKVGSVELGKGYVVRYKKSKDYSDPNLSYHYARLYVSELLRSVNGSVIGAKVKYQFPF